MSKKGSVQPLPAFMSVGIYNETDRLRSAAVWGPVGAEAILAQMYPRHISLFYAGMNVPVARKEALEFFATLAKNGVRVVAVRDVLADILESPKKPLKREVIIRAIIARAQAIRAKYASLPPSQYTPPPQKQSDLHIRQLVTADIKRYGEQKALRLNEMLCLKTDLPLGDTLYARDPMNVLLGTRVVSRMAKPIRKGEVALYEKAYSTILPADTPTIRIPKGETFEGGDAYIHNRTVYVGVGVRTSRGAARFIYKKIRRQLEARHMKFAIVEDEHPKTRSSTDAMDFMHLDTFSGPIGDRQITVCKEEAERRRVKYLETDSRGRIIEVDTKKNFLEHLKGQEDLVIVIPRAEQRSFGCNFLALDQSTIFMPLASNKRTNSKLRKAGKRLIFLGLQESTNGYGASHCMTGQLLRTH